MNEPDPSPVGQGQALAALHAISARALQRNRDRAAELGDTLSAAAGGQLGDLARRSAVEAAHQLVGSAGTFGYRRVSELARELELLLVTSATDDVQGLGRAAAVLVEIQRRLEAGPEADSDL